MFHIFVYEHCFTISLVRNLESNVLTYLNKYGKERIGKTLRTKRDKTLYNENYDKKNNRWCAGFLLIFAVILGICFS